VGTQVMAIAQAYPTAHVPRREVRLHPRFERIEMPNADPAFVRVLADFIDSTEPAVVEAPIVETPVVESTPAPVIETPSEATAPTVPAESAPEAAPKAEKKKPAAT